MIINRTVCEDCIFAEMDAVLGLPTQVGCKVRKDKPKRLPGFSQKGNWMLQGLCQYERPTSWLQNKETLEDSSKRVREEVKTEFIVSFLTNAHEKTREQFLYADQLEPKLTKAIFTDPGLYLESLKHLETSKGNQKRVLVLDDKTDWRIIQGREAGSCQYFGCFEDLSILPTNFFKYLDQAINDEGFRFMAASNLRGDILISTRVFANIQMSIKDILDFTRERKSYYEMGNLIERAANYA